MFASIASGRSTANRRVRNFPGIAFAEKCGPPPFRGLTPRRCRKAGRRIPLKTPPGSAALKSKPTGGNRQIQIRRGVIDAMSAWVVPLQGGCLRGVPAVRSEKSRKCRHGDHTCDAVSVRSKGAWL